MERIPILHVIHGFSDNSMTRIVCRLVEYLTPQGFDLHVGAVTREEPMQEEVHRLGGVTVEFAGTGAPVQQRLREYVAAHHIRLVHSHTPRTAILTVLALWRQRSQMIHVTTRHLLAFPRDRRLGLVYTALDRVSLYLANHIVPVSKKMEGQIRSLPLIRAGRVAAIQNGVDTRVFYVPEEREPCRAEFGVGPGTILLGFTGRIAHVKRLDVLLEAFARILPDFPDTRLMIVGRGEEEKPLRALAQELNIAHAVIWAGFRTDIPRLLAALDVYVQTSDNEGLSLSILEAMAAGNAVIATDVGAAREVLRDRENGLIVPPGSAGPVAAAMRWLLEDRERIRTISAAGRATVNQQFSVQSMADAYGALYRRLLASQRQT